MNGQDSDTRGDVLEYFESEQEDRPTREGSGVVDLLQQRATRRERGERLSIVINGGSGGVGTSTLAANLALYIGRQNRRVTLVDLDSSGPALHTRLGIPIAVPTPALRCRTNTIRHEHLPGTQLSLIGPTRCFSGEESVQMHRTMLDEAHRSSAEFLVIDIGRGSSELAVDSYLDADLAISVAMPDPVAIEQTYAFLRTVLVRALIQAPTDGALSVRKVLATPKGEAMPSFSALFDYLNRNEDVACEAVREALADVRPSLIMNRCQNRADREMLRGMSDGIQMRWGVETYPLGTLDEDAVAYQAARWRRPLLTSYPSSTLATGIERIGSHILSNLTQQAMRA